jgi:hypothetical protein
MFEQAIEGQSGSIRFAAPGGINRDGMEYGSVAAAAALVAALAEASFIANGGVFFFWALAASIVMGLGIGLAIYRSRTRDTSGHGGGLTMRPQLFLSFTRVPQPA